MFDPVLFMRENIKGKSDISKCDHGDWFRDPDGECMFIEGSYILNGTSVILTCGMKMYADENRVLDQFNCQNCGDKIKDCDLTELLLCKKCKEPGVILLEGGMSWNKY